jgi:hypothetical protein
VPSAADESRRFFDFTPVSATNPVVATLDGTIQIPLSELRGFREAEKLQAITDPASLAQKRAVLDELINQYLYVDEAYRAGVPFSADFTRRMDATRTMILTDFLAMRAAAETKTPALVETGETADAGAALAEHLFEAASIVVSNEAYALLKRAAKAIDDTTAAAQLGPVTLPAEEATQQLHAILNRTPEATLVRYEERSISVRQILVIYAGLPAARRPRVEQPQGLIEMIKPLILPELMAIEAAKRGIAAEPAFQQKLIQNRNALLRFHAHGAIESRANDTLRGPDLESRLQAWYRQNAALYAAPAEAGGNAPGKPLPYAEVRDRVLGDFSVDLRDRLLAEKALELRKVRRVVVVEAVLRSL